MTSCGRSSSTARCKSPAAASSWPAGHGSSRRSPAEDAASFARQEGAVAVTAYVAAKAAEPAGGDEGYFVERAWQAGWLRERLGLSA
jgi:hypothetical protein